MTGCNRDSLSLFGAIQGNIGVLGRWSQSVASLAHSKLAVLSIAGLMAFCSVSAWAQSSSAGTVSGQVKDQQGLAVPGVEVKIIEPVSYTHLAVEFRHH